MRKGLQLRISMNAYRMRSYALYVSLMLCSPMNPAWALNCVHAISNPKDSTVQSSFSLSRNADVITVTIKYEIEASGNNKDPDLDQSPVTVLDYLREHPGQTVLNANGIEGELLQIVEGNPLVTSMIEYPVHMKKIFDLIKGRSKKEEAKKIYKEANLDKVVTNTSKTNYRVENGTYLDIATYSFSFQVIIRDSTALVIPGFIFTHNNNVYRTKEMVIDLE